MSSYDGFTFSDVPNNTNTASTSSRRTLEDDVNAALGPAPATTMSRQFSTDFKFDVDDDDNDDARPVDGGSEPDLRCSVDFSNPELLRYVRLAAAASVG